MILEYLQPDPSIWDGLTVVLRAFYNVATIGGAGLVFFAIGFGHRLEPAEWARLRRLLVVAVAAGIGLSALALGLRVLVLTAGASVTDGAVWGAVLRSRIGDAFWLRAGGLLLMLALVAPWRAGDVAPWRAGDVAPGRAGDVAAGRAGGAIAAVGAVAALASYAAMGHSMLFRPRQEIAALVVLHLAVVAFWVGSLPPLLWVAGRRDGAGAAALVAAWSRAATVAVGLMLASGLLLTWYVTVRLDLILAAWHGWALLWKVALVLGALALALWNRLRHTPALARGEGGAGLARSIRAEGVLVLLAFYAAAELVSVHPIDYGHRVAN